MSTSYLISSAVEESALAIDLEEFRKRLTEQWPTADVRSIADCKGVAVIEWSIELAEQDSLGNRITIDGILWKSGDAISFSSQWEQSVIFALWFRTTRPEQERLLLYDASFNHDAELKIDTTTDDIDAAFS